jgi:hypothetical protein
MFADYAADAGNFLDKKPPSAKFILNGSPLQK